MSIMQLEERELQEIAGAILDGILAEKKRADSVLGAEPGPEALERTERLEEAFLSEAGPVRGKVRRRGFFTDPPFRESLGRAEKKQAGHRSDSEDYFELRTERRGRRREEAVSANEDAEGFSFSSGGSGFDDRLPERLSEAFCRDARRYDGAFERY